MGIDSFGCDVFLRLFLYCIFDDPDRLWGSPGPYPAGKVTGA
jgi:hypothetical protein